VSSEIIIHTEDGKKAEAKRQMRKGLKVAGVDLPFVNAYLYISLSAMKSELLFSGP